MNNTDKKQADASMAIDNATALTPDSHFVQVLRDNPTIFQRHPELLELVSLSDSRGTASLLEKQVEALKQRLRAMQNRQSDFVEVARENEQISDSFAAIISLLIGYQNLSEFAAEFPAALRNTFNIDEVSIKTAASVTKRESEQEAYHAALERLPKHQAVCDNRWPNGVLRLFFSERIKSAALVPLKAQSKTGQSDQDNPIIAVLALGSTDPERYTHELGTAHLSRLGLMAGICLKRLQPQA